MKSTVRTFLAAAGLFLVPMAAHAHGRGGACRADLKALCPDVTPGPGGFHACLQTLCPDITPGPGAFESCLQRHSDQLSAACQEQISKMQAKVAAFRQACSGDVQTLCSTAVGPRAIFKCLHKNRDQLSEACAAVVAKQGHHHHRHHGCDHDATPTPTAE